MIEYNGELGKFTYDERFFLDDGDRLLYIGPTKYGCMVGQIPEGILHCDFMFAGNTRLKVGPVLPKSCISASSMFEDCTNLVVYPDINLALMESDEFDSRTMFAGCKALEKLSISEKNRRIDPYLCACQHSVDYEQHCTNVKECIERENQRREEQYNITHFFRNAIKKSIKKRDVSEDAKKVDIRLSYTPIKVEFDSDETLTYILSERKKGNIIGFVSNGNRKSDARAAEDDSSLDGISDSEDTDIGEAASMCGNPELMNLQ